MADMKNAAAAAPARVPTVVDRSQDSSKSQPSTKNRIRVVLILYRDDLNVGGSLRVVETLAHALDPARVDVHVVFTYGSPGPIAGRVGVSCHFLDAKGPLDFSAWKRARRLMEDIQPDILHFHNPAYWLHAALSGRNYKKLIHLHGPYFPERMGVVDRWLMRRSGKLADAMVCITRDMRQMVLREGWAASDRVWTVYNSIDCIAPESAPDKKAARAALRLPENALVIGIVCRLAWYKGCTDGIKLLDRLPSNWHLLYCGDGPMKPYLADMAREAGLADRTHFAGVVSDMRVAYASMDAFLFLSKLEPFGLVIAEAMAARVPVFGLAAEGAYRDSLYPLITPENSIFVERSSPGDYISPEPAGVINQLAKHVIDYGHDPESLVPMIDRAQEWVIERFDGRVQAQAMTEVYDFVLNRPIDAPK